MFPAALEVRQGMHRSHVITCLLLRFTATQEIRSRDARAFGGVLAPDSGCKMYKTSGTDRSERRTMIVSRQRKRRCASFQQLPQLAATIGTLCAGSRSSSARELRA